MRECVVSERDMACTDCRKASNFSIDTKGIKKRNWRTRIRYLLKITSSFSSSKCMAGRSYRPTVEEVNQWAQSLDKLLSHKYGKAAFQIFLKSEFCDENIEFWTACEEFRTMTSLGKLSSRARTIYEEFIQCDAPKEINLDYQTKDAIIQSLPLPSLTCFLSAQKKVFNLMENNSYPRFIHSELYKELCAVARGEGKYLKF
ncbi:regulator of G-protein signaling 21-like [Oncorhynchus tshawytscha]|uniref:RGS domain-containing protein n=1 Tax=Oncorhynchus tshawytscha TaxID=74940 RepID=A0A8C8HZW9_ONCTS|nr:regulator of G-protein signaling 21-like [Oncorhynchus tshawytscha]